MLSMTSPAHTDQHHPRAAKAPPPSERTARRLVLVPAIGRDDELVRRYRLARLRLEPRQVRGDERFAHLTRAHD
jgi:hypothetical protein